jgi:fructose-1,6-bisphosphatase/inositol monophosphatase family enzyme
LELNELEQACLSTFQRGGAREISYPTSTDTPGDWIRFCFLAALEVGRVVRALRWSPLRDLVSFKGDGSPTTTGEAAVEELVRARLRAFSPGAVLVGEETGGALPESGVAVAVDPVDGTWSLLNRTETIATSLAVIRDGHVIAGLVLNPATGELAYAAAGGPTRLVQLGLFGASALAMQLPVERVHERSCLVNLQPSRSAAKLSAALCAAWNEGEVQMLRSSGGSPAWSLLDTAKGSTTYVNLWGKRPAAPYDLAAAVLLVQGAGGRVTDLSGAPVDPLYHRGPFVAGVDAQAHAAVLQLVREALRRAGAG